MNISDASININIATNSSNSIKQGNVNVSNAGTVTANAQITQAKEGQIFNGKILDITNDKVSIMLDNNKTLFAQMTDAVNMNIGDSLTFMIKENTGTNVFIKPFGDGVQNMKDSAIFKILDTNSISATQKNYEIAETLMKNNMPVDKASMQRIMQQSYKYPDASVDTLINLTKLGIPVNESNINQFQSYVTNNHQLTGDINNLSNSIVDYSKAAIGEILNQMGATSDGQLQQITSVNNSLMSALSDIQDMSNINIDSLLQGTIEPEATLIKAEANGTDIISQFSGENSTQINNLSQLSSDISSGITPEIDSIATKLSLDSESLQGLINDLKNAGVKDSVIKEIVNKSDTPMQLMNNINEVINNSDKLNLQLSDIKNILLSDNYNSVLSESIKNKLSLNPKDMENPKELDDLYKSIYDKTNKLMEAFSSGSNSSAGDSMSQAAKSMQQRLDFMQNLNNMYAYAQIPVKLDQNQMNSDLYVYMNKRNIKDTKEAVSALLHLDMDHLGATDVHVSLHGTNVHTRFYVEDEVSARIIDEHMTMLEKAINDNGFQLTNEVITREPALATEANMVVKEMLGDDLEKSVKRYSFDVRM